MFNRQLLPFLAALLLGLSNCNLPAPQVGEKRSRSEAFFCHLCKNQLWVATQDTEAIAEKENLSCAACPWWEDFNKGAIPSLEFFFIFPKDIDITDDWARLNALDGISPCIMFVDQRIDDRREGGPYPEKTDLHKLTGHIPCHGSIIFIINQTAYRGYGKSRTERCELSVMQKAFLTALSAYCNNNKERKDEFEKHLETKEKIFQSVAKLLKPASAEILSSGLIPSPTAQWPAIESLPIETPSKSRSRSRSWSPKRRRYQYREAPSTGSLSPSCERTEADECSSPVTSSDSTTPAFVVGGR
jgi:hypothetical protein